MNELQNQIQNQALNRLHDAANAILRDLQDEYRATGDISPALHVELNVAIAKVADVIAEAVVKAQID